MIELLKAENISAQAIMNGRKQQEDDVSALVRDIIENVKQNKDEALKSYSEKFDGVKLENFLVSALEIKEACEAVGEEFMQILREAAENISEFHNCQKRQGFIKADRPGVVMGQKIIPLGTAGLYVPGGTAAYPSTVLMSAVPAKIAGVERMIMCTPPGKDGKVSAAILAAASVAGVNEIYKIGGAQAVAAMAFGTQSVPKTDKIVGPGNIFVSTAKKLVYGNVDIDMIAGPSDVLIVADGTANPVFVAADMLAQAEHDPLAAAVVLTTDEKLAFEIQNQLKKQIEDLPRKEIASASIKSFGKIILCQDVIQAMRLANELAPEHLEICTANPFELLPLVENAGSIFLGENTPEALGDYFAGPNHTLPTLGTSRFYSPLSVDDFVKKSSYLYYSASALKEDGEKVATFAQAEGLQAHAQSVKLRLDNIPQ